MKIFQEYKNILNKNKEIDEETEKKKLELKGFTSTTLDKEIAFKFMFKGLSKDDVPVLYQINNLNPFYLDYLFDKGQAHHPCSIL